MSDIIAVVSHTYVAVWVLASFAAMGSRIKLARTIRSELRPLYLPAAVVGYWMMGDPLDFWHLLWLAMAVLNYALDRDDDDRWKRRRKKLTEKIARQGSRLVVVPAGAR